MIHTIVSALIFAMSPVPGHAETTGKMIWVCQENYVCIENRRGEGQIKVYPAKIGASKRSEKQARMNMRFLGNYSCRPGTRKPTGEPISCQYVLEDAN